VSAVVTVPVLSIEQTDRVAGTILEHCMSRGIIGRRGERDGVDGLWADFHMLRERLYATFEVPATTLTPLAARVLFGIGALRQPRRIAVCGCYAGNLMAWVTGCGFGPFARYEGARAVGLDVDAEAIGLATANFARAGFATSTVAEVADAFDADRFAADGPWDLVLIDVDVPGARKSGYCRLLERWRPYLADNALVVAHDISHPVFAWDLRAYKDFVRACGAVDTATLPVDECGFEVSRWPVRAQETGAEVNAIK
jgi:predicted O-methyltransferase YrrM